MWSARTKQVYNIAKIIVVNVAVNTAIVYKVFQKN